MQSRAQAILARVDALEVGLQEVLNQLNISEGRGDDDDDKLAKEILEVKEEGGEHEREHEGIKKGDPDHSYK
jgi:hypothetical protein